MGNEEFDESCLSFFNDPKINISSPYSCHWEISFPRMEDQEIVIPYRDLP